jgi:hypothetical protein
LFHSNDDIIVLFGLPGDTGRQDRRAGGSAAAGGRKSDSCRQLNRIMALPARKRTGHVVAARWLRS